MEPVVYAQNQSLARIDSLIKQLDKAKEDTNKVNLLDNIADGFGDLYPDESIKYELEELNLAEKLHWKKGIGAAYAHLADDYYTKDNYPLSLNYMRKSVNIFYEINDKDYLVHELNLVAILFQTQKKPDSAIAYYEKALAIGESLKNYDYIGGLYINMAIIYNQTNASSKALQYGLKAREIADKIQTQPIKEIIEAIIGRAYLGIAKKDTTDKNASLEIAHLDSAIKYLNIGVAKCNNAKSYNNVVQFSTMLAQAYSMKNSYKQAFETIKKAQVLNDSLVTENNNVEKELRENLIKTKENQLGLANKQLVTERKSRIYFITGIVLLFVIVGITIRSNLLHKKLNNTITRLVTEQESVIQQRTLELAKSNEKLAHANKKLVELIQYNAHNLREPLARVMGAMIIQEYMSSEEFYNEVWPQMQKAVTDLDNSIKDVITIADDTVNLYG